MSLYGVQKVIYELNRSPQALQRFRSAPDEYLSAYELDPQETQALQQPDIGLLYVLGVNGQLLMHFAAAAGYDWNAYLEAMRTGLREHGPVRAGIYKAVGEHC
ncbi:aromatic ring-opening dioxygenase subunit LigA [Hydrogenophaga sp. YM1]|uniref:aromatic ring-opening dioxygenase subunit LigA n=1 Tax=unclassified Hydrogenophaga TaxID=2610897 RepID=UPI0008782F71|nr:MULTISPECIES: aromatic ring-opening dioxygenase subunit LigA [unclassified Hydrogenophaga]QRR33683.1 aromatic ring-opening dioxygenase subunit LigA [Hydrogenophaga sp. YM1]